jgi:hypothetical protein
MTKVAMDENAPQKIVVRQEQHWSGLVSTSLADPPGDVHRVQIPANGIHADWSILECRFLLENRIDGDTKAVQKRWKSILSTRRGIQSSR